MSLALFAQLALLSTEERWKKALRNMSDGVFPSGFLYCPERRRLSYDTNYMIIDEISVGSLHSITSFITLHSSGYNGMFPVGEGKIAKKMIPYYILGYCTAHKYSSQVARKLMQAYAVGSIKRADLLFQSGKLIEIQHVQVVAGQVSYTRSTSTISLCRSMSSHESSSVSV